MEGFNNQQGASDRDVEGGKGEVVATEAAAVEGVADAYKIRTRQKAFPNLPPRCEDPNKITCLVLTIVALPRVLRGDRQRAKADVKTLRTQTVTKYSTNGTCVILTETTSRTSTIHNSATCTVRRMDH